MVRRLSVILIPCIALAISFVCCDEGPVIDAVPPAAVTDLRVAATGTTTVRLEWTATGDNLGAGTASEYDMRYSVSGVEDTTWDRADQCGAEPAPGKAGTAETLTVGGLLPGTTYYFAMKVGDAEANWSDLSNLAQATTLDAAGPDIIWPAAVSDLAAEVLDSSSVVLRWSASGDDSIWGVASEYDIRYSTEEIDLPTWADGSRCESEPEPQDPGSLEEFTVTGLSPATTYFFAMRVKDEVPNWSGLSNPAQATTMPSQLDSVPPAAINDLESAVSAFEEVHLRWTAPGDDGITGVASEYDIRFYGEPIDDTNWETASQVVGEPSPAIAGTVQSLRVKAPSSSTIYYFAMRTKDNAGNWSDLSNVPSTLSQCDPGCGGHGTPVDFEAYHLSDRSLKFHWGRDPGDAGDFEIRRSSSPIDDWNWDDATACSGTLIGCHNDSWYCCQVDGLSPSTTYYFGIRQFGSGGGWSRLSVCSVTTLDYADETPPAAVLDLVAEPVDTASVMLRWTAPGNDGSEGTASEYDIRYSDVPMTDIVAWCGATYCKSEPVPQPSGSPESFLIENLTPETDYYFALKARDDVPLWSDLSNVAQARISVGNDTIPPDTVNDLEVALWAGTQVHLRWTAPSDDRSPVKLAEYDIRYMTETIDSTNWEAASQADNIPIPRRPGSVQDLIVPGFDYGVPSLAPNTLYYFAMRTRDWASNWSAVSNVDTLRTADCRDWPPYYPDYNFPTPQAYSPSPDRIELSWEPKWLGHTIAYFYDIRISTSPIDDWNWHLAARCPGQPEHEVVGDYVHFTYMIQDLNPNTTYFIGARAGETCYSRLRVTTATTPEQEP
jgi:chitodextrinase